MALDEACEQLAGTRWAPHHMPGVYLGVDALTKAVQAPQGQQFLQYLSIGPIEPVVDPKALCSLRGHAIPVIKKLLTAAPALAATAQVRGEDEEIILLTALAGAFTLLAYYLNGDGWLGHGFDEGHRPAQPQGNAVNGEHQAPQDQVQRHDPGDSPRQGGEDQHHPCAGDDHGRHGGDEDDEPSDADGAFQLGYGLFEFSPWPKRLCQNRKKPKRA